MLYKDRLKNELRARKDAFTEFSKTQNEEVRQLAGMLAEAGSTASTGIIQRLGSSENTGALPSEEFDGSGSAVRPFGIRWSNHEEARVWAAGVLDGRTTFAADGSQLYLEKETSLPVGAIQIGWFENPHDPQKPYRKDVSFELMTPADLIADGEEPADPETRIGERRFHAEVEKAFEFLEKKRGWQEAGERMPLAFFDGTLLVSFSLPQTRLQKSFIDAMVDLVAASARTRVPLIGYIDRSLSRDLINMLTAFGARERDRPYSLSDAGLLSSVSGVLDEWGDRTRFLYSNRSGMAAFFDKGTGLPSVGFCYLATSSSSPPARLDIPSWIYEAGLLDEVADVVRAECVIGLGYPYPLETADATAVISAKDRHIFLRALQDFAVREKLNFSVSMKDASKKRRR